MTISLKGLYPTAAAGGSVNYQEFTSNGTWTKPDGCTAVYVELVGGGGGGGSGARRATTSARFGGQGGAGGVFLWRMFKATDLSATVSITVGAGGAGGAAQTANTTNGNNGSAGGDSQFGTYLTSATAGFGLGGTTGQNSTGGLPSYRAFIAKSIGSSNVGYGFNASLGDGSWPNPTVALDPDLIGTSFGGAGGGGGLGQNANTTTSQTGRAGGICRSLASSSTGAAAGANGTANEGGGGGGGSYTTATTGMNGGNGAFPGGGGGGGSASDNGYNSGAGGNGGAGVVRVWSW